MRRAALQAALISAVVFVLYAALAARDVMFGDGPELTSAAILNTVAHPPGYPLWIMLGHLASLLPAGPLPYRVNLTACVSHSLTVGLVYASAYVLTKRQLPALIAAIVLGLGSPLFVVWSLQAEVFSLTDTFAAAIVLLSLMIIDQPRRWQLVIALAVIFGLGLSHQTTLLLLGPAALWALWCARRAIPCTAQAAAVAFLAAALLLVGFALPYVHTLIISQHIPWQLGRARSLSELLWVIERRDYGGAFSLVGVTAAQGGDVYRPNLGRCFPTKAGSTATSSPLYRRMQFCTAGDAVDQPPVYFQGVEHWRPDVTIVVYGTLNAVDYVRRLRQQINIPDQIVLMQDPALRRDVIAFENPHRPLYCVGETGIHAPGPRYTPQVLGIVSRILPRGTRIITPANLRSMVAAQSISGYGNVTSSYWRSNGFSLPIREYYAGGFFTTGYYAELLHDRGAALAGTAARSSIPTIPSSRSG